MYRILIISSAGGLLVRSDDTCVESTGAGGLWLYYDKTTFVPDQRITVSCFSEGYLEGQFWVIKSGDTKKFFPFLCFLRVCLLFSTYNVSVLGKDHRHHQQPKSDFVDGGRTNRGDNRGGGSVSEVEQSGSASGVHFHHHEHFYREDAPSKFFDRGIILKCLLNRVLTCQTPISPQIFN